MNAAASAVLAAPAETDAPPVSREAAENVLEYLVFHQSLLGEKGGGSPELDRYLELVKSLKEGIHVVIEDPAQKATAMLFELVLDQAFDPWQIDLVKFVGAYSERVRREGAVDFPIAGRLVAMAWSILYLQSEAVLEARDSPPEPAAEGAPDLPDEGYLGLMQTPEAVDVTSAVLDGDVPPALVGMVRHPETRPVSLLELLRAFGEAETDARRSVRQQELRELLREEARSPPEVLVHGDIPERDVEDVWSAACRHPIGAAFPFLSLHRPQEGRDRLVALFLAALYLSRERAIEFEQAEMLRGPLELVRLSEERRPLIEEAR